MADTNGLGSPNFQEWVTNGTSPVTNMTIYNGSASFQAPWGVGIDSATGNVYVTDEVAGQIDVFNSAGTYLTNFGSTYLDKGFLGVALNSAGTTVYALTSDSIIYIVSVTPGSIPTYTLQTGFGQSGSVASYKLLSPQNLRVDGNGYVWVADQGNHRVAEYTGAGIYNLTSFITVTSLANPFMPSDVLVDSSGNVYATDNENNYVVEFNSSGTQIGQFGEGILYGPNGITTDGAGNFYVTDSSPQIVGFH